MQSSKAGESSKLRQDDTLLAKVRDQALRGEGRVLVLLGPHTLRLAEPGAFTSARNLTSLSLGNWREAQTPSGWFDPPATCGLSNGD